MTLNVAEIVISAQDKTKDAFESVGRGIEGLQSRTAHLIELLGVGMFAEMIAKSMESADQLNKMSQSVGVSVESLSRLSLSAKLSDVDMETLGKSMGKLNKNIMDCADGNGAAQKAFDALGISVKDSQGHLKNSDQVMAEVADKFAGLNDGAGKTAIAMDIFGKAGAAMIPMLNQGGAALKENADMADKLGLTLSQDTAAGAEAVNDRFALMGQATKGLVNTAMTQLLPTIDSISKMFVESATDTDNLKRKVEVLEGAIKSLITAGIVVKDVFAEVSTALGGVVSAAMLAMQGDFAGAKNALSNMGNDMVDTMAKDMDAIAKLWTDNEPKVTTAAKEAAKKTINGYGQTAKTAMKAVKDEEYANAMAMLEAELKEKVAYGQKHQKNLDLQLANMMVSERDFYAAKKLLILQDLEDERHYLETELALANSKEERLKAIEIQGRIERNKIAAEEASGPTAYDAKANKASMSPLELEKKSFEDRQNLAKMYYDNQLKLAEKARQKDGESEQQYQARLQDADMRQKSMLLQAQQDHEANMTSLIQRGAVTRNDFENMTGKQQLQTHLALLSNTLGASATHSRTAFEMMKKVKLAEAAISLPSTVMKAYESGMAAGGPAGPAVGAAYAALAFATQMIQMNAINAAQFGGGSAGAAPAAGGVSPSAVPGQAANPNQVSANPSNSSQAQPPSQPVNIYLNGNVMTPDFVANTVIPEIKNQISNADVTIIDPRSRQAQMLAGA